jgi:hypothetical protein
MPFFTDPQFHAGHVTRNGDTLAIALCKEWKNTPETANLASALIYRLLQSDKLNVNAPGATWSLARCLVEWHKDAAVTQLATDVFLALLRRSDYDAEQVDASGEPIAFVLAFNWLALPWAAPCASLLIQNIVNRRNFNPNTKTAAGQDCLWAIASHLTDATIGDDRKRIIVALMDVYMKHPRFKIRSSTAKFILTRVTPAHPEIVTRLFAPPPPPATS